MLLIIHLAMTLIFVILGLVFRKGKGSFLIAGYNTASPAQKKRTDEKKLCRFMSRFMFVLAGCWLVVAAGSFLESMAVFWAGLALFLVAISVGVILANTGDRFRP